MSVELFSGRGRRNDLLFTPRSLRSRNSLDSNGPEPDDFLCPPASSPFPLSPLSTSTSSTATLIPTSDTASSLDSSTSSSSSIYPLSSPDYSPALSPSSTSNSVAAVAAVDSTVALAAPGTYSAPVPSPPRLPLQEPDLARLSLKSISRGANRHFAPRTSSLSTLPTIATISTTIVAGSIERRAQSLASNNHLVPPSAASSTPTWSGIPLSSPTYSASNKHAPTLSLVTTRPIKRKPLATSNNTDAVVLPSVQRVPSLPPAHAKTPSASECADNNHFLDEYELDDSETSFDREQNIRDDPYTTNNDSEPDVSIDDFLPTPQQRFTRSGSADSPTLYEFPTTAAFPSTLTPLALISASNQSHSPSLFGEEADQDSAFSLLYVDSAFVAVGTSTQNDRQIDSAAPQIRSVSASAPHRQDVVSVLYSDFPVLSKRPGYDSENSIDQEQALTVKPDEASVKASDEPIESEEPEEFEISSIEAPYGTIVQEDELMTQRNSTMSLFTRKTSPPHLSLSTANNNNSTTPNNINEEDAQSSEAPNNRNSLYSIYDDEELQDKNIPIGLPTISTSTVHNNNTNTGSQTPHNKTTTSTSDADSPGTLRPNNKSPNSFKLGNFFGWPSASPSTTEFSDQGFSPLPSPSSLQAPPSTTFTHASTLSTPGTNISSPRQDDISSFGGISKNRNLLGIISPPTRSNTLSDESASNSYYEDYLQTPPIASPETRAASSTSPSSTYSQIDEMEDELKAISAELAGSIRREMDLEDLVDRLQTEINNPQPPSKRTSDYFSDSGAVSSKFGEYDAAREEVAQIQRRAEQEKAQIRLELTEKLTDERSRRRLLDQQIKELSERASGLDLDVRNNSDASDRVKQLEGTCEDLRRRLSEERSVKENFEDLLTAMKTELQNASNERDNLRDEVVPQLRARVEGLESEASEHARQIYETTKMQQELQTLKSENSNLRSASALGVENGNNPPALSRSKTIKGQPSGPPSATATVATTNESREALAERLKDVEAQRDALHSALKSLLERQEVQKRENEKHIRVFEVERQRLLTVTPTKAGYERSVANLRDEVGVLRHRAEEALEQKWQVEKGLSGLKMDLDRAEEEIAGLRSLLQQRDILLPSSGSSRSVSNTSSVYDTDGTGATSLSSHSLPVTSASLETAYKNLQKSYADALNRIRSLENSSSTIPGSTILADEKTALALERLERSLNSAMAERDAARDEVATHTYRLADFASSEKTMLEGERSLAEQLDLSARRVEELAQQVRTQLETNIKLRDRLAHMIGRGEADQQTHKNRITSLELRLRSLEEQLIASQTAAEDRVTRHEEQIATLKEAHSTQLQRLRDASGGVRAATPPNGTNGTAPRMLSSSQFGGLGSLGGISGAIRSPTSPMVSVNGKAVPTATSTGNASSAASVAEQQAQVATLKARVSELEMALANADTEMQEVVGRMNMAQIEVMQLQEELEAAGRETRRLQRTVETEKVKGFEERFKMLNWTTAA
ncbi:hypothetical protein SEPCBS57363_002872 [Sporothrix epigloea]|uniref:DUF7603 domain-containing protein n=1 Tax=Sporothrix epigloea TaxID=1892477 RepID=A0ABP0DLW2_9PEZI